MNPETSSISVKSFWYIVATSSELKPNHPLGVKLLDEWIALYRDRSQKVVAVRDRCLHRNARLSKGTVRNGELVCPYHGWKYGSKGALKNVPSEGPHFQTKASHCLPSFPTYEKEGYIYVKLSSDQTFPTPYFIPYLGKAGYQHIRLKHIFQARVSNCAENFIDIPHTTYVHPGVFRYTRAPQKLTAEIERENGNVHIRYRNETSNFGWFSQFLNRSGVEIFHEDHYYLPNITHVEYRFGKTKHFNIISQSIPVSENETHVYTDLTYNYGFWNYFTQPIVRWVAKRIIAQDVKIMKEQTEVTNQYGQCFASTPADLQHVWIEKIYSDLLAGKDPRALPLKKQNVDFWI